MIVACGGSIIAGIKFFFVYHAQRLERLNGERTSIGQANPVSYYHKHTIAIRNCVA